MALTRALFALILLTFLLPQRASAQPALVLSATFNSIAAEIPCNAQDGLLAYKKTADSTYLDALPLWRSGGICRGSVVLLEAGTSYDIKVTVDGGEELGTISTRADAIPTAASLTRTHFVRLTGNDTTGDGSVTSPWATIRKAMQSAPSGAVVEVGSGTAEEYFTDAGYATGAPGPRTVPITLVSALPAVNDNGQPINVGYRTWIEGSIRSAPTGQTVAGMPTAPWTQVSLTGPTDGITRTVWKWAGAVADPSVTLVSLGYNQSRTAVPGRAWHWDHVGPQLDSPEGWSQLAWTNRTFGYGFYQDGADLYVRLPNDGNPNTRWWTGSISSGIGFNAPDSRISGFVFRGLHFAIRGGPGSDRLIVDHNEFQMITSALRTTATISPLAAPEDIVFERNFVRNTGLWSDNQAATPSAPWDFVKRRIIKDDGVEYESTRIGGRMEGGAVMTVGAHRTVVRKNTIQGTWDGVSTVNVGSPTNEPVAFNDEWDIHDNVIRQIPDDAIEPARKGQWRVWANRFEHTKTVLSTGGPTLGGPLLLFNNVAWKTGGFGLAKDYQGGPAGGQDGMIFKFDDVATLGLQARFYVVNNTFWSDWTKTYGSSPAEGSSGSRPQGFWLRNNIVRMSDDALSWYGPPNGYYDEDRNQFVTTKATRGMLRIEPTLLLRTVFADYRSDSDQGTTSNLWIDLHDAVLLDAQFVNAGTGNLILTTASILRSVGVTVPNVAPSAAPHLGAP